MTRRAGGDGASAGYRHGNSARRICRRVFDPFFTTKPVGVGTGLGLSVVKKIIDLHGGAIDIQNAAPDGVLVTLVLKAEPEETLSSREGSLIL